MQGGHVEARIGMQGGHVEVHSVESRGGMLSHQVEHGRLVNVLLEHRSMESGGLSGRVARVVRVQHGSGAGRRGVNRRGGM